MTDGAPRDEEMPLVAVVCNAPLLSEALSGAFEGIAEVRRFPARGGDATGLLRWLRPDAVVVDSDESAEAAARFARDAHAPLVRVSYAERAIDVLTDGTWTRPENGSASPETIRNILVAGMFRRNLS